MEVHQAQAGLELGRLQFFAGEEDLGGVQAEFGVVARGHRPLALAPGLELGAEADHRLHPGLGGDANDVVDLRKLLDHQDDLFAEFAAQEGQADVVVILVAVADDEPVGTLMHGKGDHELGLGTGLNAVIVVFSGGHDLVDDLT